MKGVHPEVPWGGHVLPGREDGAITGNDPLPEGAAFKRACVLIPYRQEGLLRGGSFGRRLPGRKGRNQPARSSQSLTVGMSSG
jgi:hypothetical protein